MAWTIFLVNLATVENYLREAEDVTIRRIMTGYENVDILNKRKSLEMEKSLFLADERE
jgi:hypothetical protein